MNTSTIPVATKVCWFRTRTTGKDNGRLRVQTWFIVITSTIYYGTNAVLVRCQAGSRVMWYSYEYG
eukprot:scaffold451723_cov23-Prasinocladus_malaysianus.AAC.1